MKEAISFILLACIAHISCDSQIRISLVQLSYGESFVSARAAIEKAINQSHKPDVVVLPGSMWNVADPSTVLSYFGPIARSSDTAIALSWVTSELARFTLFDRTGNPILNYTHTHTPTIATLKLNSSDSVQVGAMLSNDAYFPEVARTQMTMGARIIFFPTNGNLSKVPDDSVLHARAAENVMSIVRVNRAASTHSQDNGRSGIESYGVDTGFSTGPAGSESTIITGDVNLAALELTRKFTIWGDAFRRPFHYQELCGFRPMPPHPARKPSGTKPLPFKVAALQMISGNSVEENMAIATEKCKEAKAKGADIVIMPEMWSVGYQALWPQPWPGYYRGNMSSLGDVLKWTKLAVKTDSEFIKHFQQLAKQLNMAIGVAYLRQPSDDLNVAPTNSVTLFDRFGKELYTYSKVHTVNGAYDEALTTPGTTFYTAEINTEHAGNLTIGSFTCFDQEFPESARLNMIHKAEIILKANACGFDYYSHQRLLSRAVENSLGLVMANYAYPTVNYDGKMNGQSCAYDWMGNTLAMGGKGEEVVIGTFDMNALRRWRQTKIGNERMNPRIFPEMCDLEAEPSFTAREAYHRSGGEAV